MKKIIKSFFNQLPYVRGLYRQSINHSKNSFYDAGHYHSPIISVEDIRSREAEIWKDISVDGIPGIELNGQAQVELLNQLAVYYSDIPFGKEKKDKLRYHFENSFYSYTDGIILYSMIRHFRPQRIIEVGSGYSSALMMDVNEHFFDNNISLSFIEPEAERLYSLMSEKDRERYIVIEKRVQEVGKNYFEKLEKGDILFIDSSHVSKCGSDVNFILFEILPLLKSGVLIHFHDVFYPFEYPKDWVYRGWNWNEDYFLKAFLLYNNKFEIKLFSHYLHIHHKEVFANMPLSYLNTGGNFWIEKK